VKALITGASGFVGSHLVDYLTTHTDYELFGTSLTEESDTSQITWHTIDLRDVGAVQSMITEIKPDFLFHLAGQAFVPASFTDPWDTLENNIKSQVNLLESIRKLDLPCRVLVVSSAHVYGKIAPEENPVNESQPFRPDSPYSVSKVSQDMLALQYHLAYQMPIIRARAFNHIGPRQSPRFALPDFAGQIAAAEVGKHEPIIRVGNLNAERDFTDVRDVVRAYHLMLTEGNAGEAYNVCRGEAFSIRKLLDKLCEQSSVELTIQLDKERIRPLDVPRVVGDSSKLRQDTAWHPTLEIQQSLTDILDYSRQLRK